MTSTTTELTGEVVRAGDPGYEEARLGYNRLYQRSPQAIVFCRNTADVVNAVRTHVKLESPSALAAEDTTWKAGRPSMAA